MTVGLLVAWSAMTLPDAPLLDEVEAGARIGRTVVQTDLEKRLDLVPGSGRQMGVEHVFEPLTVPMGWWSDGGRKLAVEWGLELSPALLSRWLGYLRERELWEEQELDRRWGRLREMVGSRRFFVVALSAFPTQPRLGLGEERRQGDEETRDVIFTLESSMGRTEPSAVMVHSRRARGKGELEAVPWWQMTPVGPEVTGVFEREYSSPLIERGDYYRTWWLVWSETDLGAGEVTMKVASKRKVRVGVFGG